jgi:hypothetical protein
MSDSKVLVPSVTVAVTRDAMTIIPVTVPAHEVRVIQVLHGAEHVAKTDEQPTDKHEIDPASEAERLTMKYGPALLEKAFGAAFDLDIPKAVEAAAAAAPAKGKAKPAAEA